MPNMTLAIPEDLHRFIKLHNEINWSEIARRAMKKQADTVAVLEKLDKLTEKSMLTEEDIRELDHKIKEGIRKRLEHEIGHRHQQDSGLHHQRWPVKTHPA